MFTVVSAVYNVARYLPDFIASLDAQTFNDPPIQIIMVDDGSTDQSLDLLREWEARNSHVTVLTQENAGQGAARNYGLTVAKGKWVNFIDPDDTVPSNYFARVGGFIHEHPEVMLVSTNRIFYQEKLGRLQDGHPLKWMYSDGDVLVNLDVSPRYLNSSAAIAFFRHDLIKQLQLKFDERVRPHFEDGIFCVQYLLGSDSPTIGFMKSARYIYRKRGDVSSTLQTSVADPRRYTNVLEYGYLEALRLSSEKYGRAPDWVQNLILYEISWYFQSEEQAFSSLTAAVGDVAVQFIDHLRCIRSYLDDEVIEAFDVRHIPSHWRDIWLHGLKEESWVSPRVVLAQRDHVNDQIKIICRFIGEVPDITYFRDNQRIEPVERKICALTYFEHVLLNEEISWIPLGQSLRVEINGKRAELARGFFGPLRLIATRQDITNMFAKRGRYLPRWFKTQSQRIRNRVENRPNQYLMRHAYTFVKKNYDNRKKLRPSKHLVHLLAAREASRLQYANAWVLIDKVHDGNDNAEALFLYLRENRPDVNAWFVVQKDTAAWNRLRSRGEDHVVDYGSLEWKILMMHADNLISSHADLPSYSPEAIKWLRPATWNFIFLQHGVLCRDLSLWLNSKKISLFITSTEDEYQSVVADGTSYALTPKEVKLTGLPRFDRLTRMTEKTSYHDKDIILIAPTWRHWLTSVPIPGTQKTYVGEDFLQTEFFTSWMQLISNAQLRERAMHHNLKLAFLLHPNLQSALSLVNLPPYIEILTYDQDVQKIIAHSRLLITDYSSIFFDAGYCGTPAVFYQFDQNLVFHGGHSGRMGYFDYERDGFGPVVQTVDQAIDEISRILNSQHEGSLAPYPYGERIERTFPRKDGLCCERVTAAIEELGRPGPATNHFLAGKSKLAHRRRSVRKRLGKRCIKS